MVKSKVRGNKRGQKTKKYFVRTLLVVILFGGVLIYYGYNRFLSPNIRVSNPREINYLYIHTGSSFEEVKNSLIESKYLIDPKSFEWMAVKMDYPKHVKPGKYLIKDGMTNRELIRMLRVGKQVPV